MDIVKQLESEVRGLKGELMREARGKEQLYHELSGAEDMISHYKSSMNRLNEQLTLVQQQS